MSKEIKKVVVIGTGVIGASWCAFYLAKGLDVVATDIAPTAKASLDAYIKAAWPALEELGLSPGASLDRLSFTSDLDSRAYGRRPGAGMWPGAPGLQAGSLSAHGRDPATRCHHRLQLLRLDDDRHPGEMRKHPERCVIGHPFNPPHIIPLVEVVGGAKTSEETIARAMTFYAALGKKPVRLFKALPGHVANRLQAALYKEMLYLIEQGVLSVEDADVAVSYGPGLRWGVMGQSLQWHLGGGAGGIDHFMEHLMTPLQGIMKTLGEPNVNDALKKDVIAGVRAQLKGRSVEELADAENRVIIGALALRTEGRPGMRAHLLPPDRLTDTLKDTLANPATDATVDLHHGVDDVLADVGMSWKDCGGNLTLLWPRPDHSERDPLRHDVGYRPGRQSGRGGCRMAAIARAKARTSASTCEKLYGVSAVSSRENGSCSMVARPPWARTKTTRS